MNTQINEKMLYELRRKSKGTAYLMWLIPVIPVHRLYLREYMGALVLFLLFVSMWMDPYTLGPVFLIVSFIDFIQLNYSVDMYNKEIEKEVFTSVQAQASPASDNQNQL